MYDLHLKSGLRDLTKFKNYINRYYYGSWYLISLLIITVCCWFYARADIAFGLILALITVILITSEDITPVIPAFLILPCIFPPGATIQAYLPILPLSVPAILAIIYHLIKYRRKFDKGEMFYPLMVVSIALIFGGLGKTSSEEYSYALGTTLLLGVGVWFIYTIFNNYTSCFKGFKVYFSKSILIIGVTIATELFIFMFTRNVPFYDVTHDEIQLGALISNNVATILLLTAPFTVYLALKQKFNVVYLILSVFQYAAVFFTYSRGGMLFSVLTMPFIYIYYFYKTEHKGSFILFVLACLTFFLAIYFSFRKDFDTIFGRILIFEDGHLSESSIIRFKLFKEAWDAFCSNPLFGRGLGFQGFEHQQEQINFYWFHSTFFQVIGSLGLFGLACYVYYYYARFKIVFTNIKKEPFNFFVLMAFIGFEGYSMMDTGTFIPMPMMMTVILMTMAVEKSNKQALKEETEKAFAAAAQPICN